MTACDIQNIVAHVEVPLHGSRLDIKSMYARLNLFSTYQKSMFPGLIYRPIANPIVLLCFESGKIVLTGGRDIYCLNEAWNRMLPVVQGYVVSDGVRGSNSTGGAPSVFCTGAGAKHEREGDRTCGLVEGDVRAKCSRARRR